MRMDITVDRYATWEDLRGYMRGSAAVIGEMMAPLLGAAGPDAMRRAGVLGEAFQLTNFIRDVAEDLDRGRIYLPLEDLERFGVSEDDLRRARVTGQPSPAVRALLDFEVRRALELYEDARPGLAMVDTAEQALPGGGLRALPPDPRGGGRGRPQRVRRPAERARAGSGWPPRAGSWSPAPRRPPGRVCCPAPPHGRYVVAARQRGGTGTAAPYRPVAGRRRTGQRRRGGRGTVPARTQPAQVSSTSANPKSRSSTGAQTRRPSPRNGDPRGAEDGVGVVADDAAAGQPAVGEQLEEHARSRRPSTSGSWPAAGCAARPGRPGPPTTTPSTAACGVGHEPHPGAAAVALPGDAHRLVGEDPGQRDDEEEGVLLQRQARRSRTAMVWAGSKCQCPAAVAAMSHAAKTTATGRTASSSRRGWRRTDSP